MNDYFNDFNDDDDEFEMLMSLSDDDVMKIQNAISDEFFLNVHWDFINKAIDNRFVKSTYFYIAVLERDFVPFSDYRLLKYYEYDISDDMAFDLIQKILVSDDNFYEFGNLAFSIIGFDNIYTFDIASVDDYNYNQGDISCFTHIVHKEFIAMNPLDAYSIIKRDEDLMSVFPPSNYIFNIYKVSDKDNKNKSPRLFTESDIII